MTPPSELLDTDRPVLPLLTGTPKQLLVWTHPGLFATAPQPGHEARALHSPEVPPGTGPQTRQCPQQLPTYTRPTPSSPLGTRACSRPSAGSSPRGGWDGHLAVHLLTVASGRWPAKDVCSRTGHRRMDSAAVTRWGDPVRNPGPLQPQVPPLVTPAPLPHTVSVPQ